MIDDFPPLETNRLWLRPMQADDFAFVWRHFSDTAVSRYLVDEEPVTTPAQAQEIIDFYADTTGKSFNRWVIVRQADGRTIGTCGFHLWHKQHRRAEIGYDLEPASWRQGFMLEALQAALGFGFERMLLNRVGAMVHPDNEASLGLLNKLGFEKEGLLRDYYFGNGRFHDHWHLSLLKKGWRGG